LGKLKKADRFADFVNSLVSIYDPHTGYYPPKEKENFDIYMSGQLEGIGAQLQQKDGLIKVSRIVAGSASWKQGDLKAGDFILSVAQGDEETVDVTDMRLDDAVRLIRGKKGTEVRLTVKKVDGNIVIIPIIRDVVQLEETYAKSAVLKNNSTIGYLKLPKFYVDLSKKGGGRSCALDVKEELEKLNLENVDGLILDLRNNGGGSLQDAVKIAGFFIKEGPIVQIKSRLGSPYVMKDTDPSVEYNGPLVIMVNYFSISASEIVSAALQDYNRAIIVGSRTSYGKGTVQRFFNLDELNKMNSEMNPLGAIKLTTQKFYRVNGGATQLKGVSADIELPDAYDQIDIGEAELDHYLKWDEITPSDIISSETVKQLNNLKEKSGARIEKDSSFTLIAENAVRMKKQKDKTSFSLIFENYKAEREKSEAEAEKYNEAEKDSTGLMVNYLTDQLTSIEDDSTKLVRIKSWHKELRHDIYLHESVLILEDHLKLTE
jgi:carboxyl-terminal processing protease